MTAKKHILDSNRLKPGKIPLPHPLQTTSQSRICLITADPPASSPRAYKELVQSAEFPADLSPRIVKVIAISRLKAKYKSFESCRQLHAEHDVFLADDRIIHMLPQILGKVFYKTTTKRPVPVSLTGKENWGKQKEKPQPKVYKITPREKDAPGPDTVGSPADVGADILKALSSALVNLSQSPTTAVRVARAGWQADWVVENVEAVVEGLVNRFIPKGWRNVKSIHMKGPNTAALPIWLAEELWAEEDDVLDEVEGADAGAVERKPNAKQPKSTKRRHSEATAEDGRQKTKKRRQSEDEAGEKERKKIEKAKVEKRKEEVKKLKAEAMASAETDKPESADEGERAH